MNQKKRTQEKNKFSKLRLHSSSNKSSKSCSPRPQEKISSYFSSVLNETEISSKLENTSEDVAETLITRLRSKKCVQKINTKICSELNTVSDTPDDLNDFTEPTIIKITKAIENKTSNVENSKKNNVSKRKSQFASKPVDDYLENDTNQEHLQLAMAMSKSILDLENPQEAEIVENSYPSTQQKVMRVKQTLDQFGFKSGKPSTQPNLKTSVKLTKGKKFKYFTPTLFLRTEADRTKLIENKVSQIINNISIFNNAVQENNVVPSNTNNTETKPRSFILRDYYKEEPILFNKNAVCMSDAQESIFYNSVVQPSNVEVGVLLKDWLAIPGREATPPPPSRLEDQVPPNEIEDESVNILQVPPIQISMSPELFTDSDNDDTAEHNENIYNSSRGLLTCTDSVTQIGKEKNIESYSSTQSVSLLDINHHNNINTSIVNVAALGTETVDLSLSPFPEIPKPSNMNTTKKIQLTPKSKKINHEDSDSLSPFEPVDVEKAKSPKRKVTPKKKSPSPKKYVVTPKGRKLVSPDNQKRSSPCKRSILFTEQPQIERNPDDSISSKISEICHFESFCNDSIECFDLTHSSDDEALCMEKADENDTTANKSFTVTQLLNELSPEKNTLNKETVIEVQSSHDSQASIETVKLNVAKSYNDVDDEFSPEFDCLNISNNKVFYETLNNSLFSNNNDSLIPLEKSSDNLGRNKALNLNDLSNLDEIENCEINDNRDICSTPKNVEDLEESAIKTPSINDVLKYPFLSPKTKVGKKRNSSMFRRSHSENFIDDELFHKISTPLSVRLSTSGRELSRSVNEIDKNVLNFTTNEINENMFLSQSSISTCSDISDEELNYSCNSIFKRYNSSGKVISMSDDEDDPVISASASDSENTSKSNLELNESLNGGATESIVHFQEPLKNSAIENNLCTINKSIKHPRVLKLSTPLKVKKTANLSNPDEGSVQSTDVVATPKTGLVINTKNITPKGHYSDMDTPELNRELEKFGLKPLKRNKGVKILHYIYDSTHPYVNETNNIKILNNSSDDENSIATKRRKTQNNELHINDNNEKVSSIDQPNDNVIFFESLVQNGNQIAESEKIEDMIFERKQSTKIRSCRLPLHVAWNNLVLSSKELQESILTYTPVQVEQIYQQLKSFGFKYHIQDIIAFLDKKCITIRIAQNSRNQKKAKSTR